MAFRDVVGHQRAIKWIQTAVATNHLGHAYLFHGEPSIGKRLTAVALAQFLHCEAPEDTPIPDACGNCRACHQIDQLTHPDFLVIQPEDQQKVNPKIIVDQIRNIEHFVIYRPLVGSHKVCLIDQAEAMTLEAANALLKTLEDPPDHCLFVLISSRPEHLLPTIRSRCMTMRFSPLPVPSIGEFLLRHADRKAAEAHLLAAFTEGRLGLALTCDPTELQVKLRQYWTLLFDTNHASASAVFDISESLSKSGHVQEAIHWFWAGLRDLLFLTLDPAMTPALYKDQETTLRRMAQTISPTAILSLIQELSQLERGQQRNLNVQLGLEQFFFHLQDVLNLSRQQECA